MKYLFVLFFVLLPHTSSAFTYTRTPSSFNIENPVSVSLNISQSEAENNGWIDEPYLCVDLYAYKDLEGNIIDVDQDSQPGKLFNFDENISFTYNNAVEGQYADVYFFSSQTDFCNNASSQFSFDGEYDNNNIIFILQNEDNNPFSSLISHGDTVMVTATGENMEANVAQAGDAFYKPFLSAGLALLYALRYWIVALVIISAIVYFAYRAFRFYRH